MNGLTGQCLCGAVRLGVAEFTAGLSACHCGMCRRWSGGVSMGFDAPETAVTVKGPVRVYRSSEFAERAFCETCGSHLWLTDIGSGVLEIVPGLFGREAELTLVREVYIDAKPDGYAFAGHHARISREDYEAEHRFVDQGDPR